MLLSKFHFARRLIDWYDRNQRNLPWRASPGNAVIPYHVLVSELMLQQTQVATVIPYFNAFIKRWPTIVALAAAEEQEVLARWQGLGYYSRARNLLRAARQIASEHGGAVPADLQVLRSLPGIGRYTAGAVASIGFDLPAPIVDGNVARVISRLDCIDADLRAPETQRRLWERAEAMLPKRRVGDFNSAMMELGATVCTPRNPQCLICPVRQHCQAFAAGMQDQIPPPRKAKPTPLLQRQTCCVRSSRDGEDHWLIEQRPPRGRWAGMWQFITLEAAAEKTLRARLQQAIGLKVGRLRHLAQIEQALTHRRYRFEVYACEAMPTGTPLRDTTRRWVRICDLQAYPLPRPHARIADLLRHSRHSPPVMQQR
jgi:A/G-specific adenine glycosylase